MSTDYKYLGDFSSTPPWHSRAMACDNCKVSWTGCWDNFQCPQCGEGDLPTSQFPNECEECEGTGQRAFAVNCPEFTPCVDCNGTGKTPTPEITP